MSETIFDLARGYKKNHYIEDATDNAATNLKFDSTTAQNYIVPADKRWVLFGGLVLPDVNATVRVGCYDSSNKPILELASVAAGLNYVPYSVDVPIILDESEYVSITFGAAQGAGAMASCIVIEIDME